MNVTTRRQAPCNVQTAQQVEDYYRNVKEGDVAVIRDTQGNIFGYRLDKITGTNPRLGRVYIENGDSWGGRAYYAKNGKSCMSPTGQINLVVPTEEVSAWMKENAGILGDGILSWEVDYDPTPPGQRKPGHKRPKNSQNSRNGSRVVHHRRRNNRRSRSRCLRKDEGRSDVERRTSGSQLCDSLIGYWSICGDGTTRTSSPTTSWSGSVMA